MINIYCYNNNITGDVYIGLTERTLEERMHSNKYGGYKECIRFYNALSKYGIDSFDRWILEVADTKEQAAQSEIFWIAEMRRVLGKEHVYNLTDGGDLGPSEATKIKIGLAQQGEKSHHAILSENQVVDILNKWSSGQYTQIKLAQEYDINRTTICDIIQNKTWKHIQRPIINIDNLKAIQKKNKIYSHPENASKVSKIEVKEIIRLYQSGNYTQKELGAKYNITREAVGKIIRGENWKHIECDRKIDASIKGTHKLNDKIVIDILALYKMGNYSYEKLANIYGVHKSNIAAIIKGKTYKHIERK